MSEPLKLAPNPELFFGLVAPIGVDLDLVTEILIQALEEMDYRTDQLRLTKLMREVSIPRSMSDAPHIQSYQDRIAYANELRKMLGGPALSILAISAIRTYRQKEHERLRGAYHAASDTKSAVKTIDSVETDRERPLASQAFVIRQLKRPDEIAVLRSVYGRQFVLISAYASENYRIKRIEELERKSRGGLISDVEVHKCAYELVKQDSKEDLDEYGQNVRDAFPLGDVFIDTTNKTTCEQTLRRFIKLLFGNNEITPTHDEYGMYLAKSASLRSSDLSRQVGAAIFHRSGEVLSLGCNEVPKAGGGTYWSEDATDGRDFVTGHDPNELRKKELLVDLLNRLKENRYLSDELLEQPDSYEITKILLESKGQYSVKDSKIMDLLEFGRIIHAEMSAICDSSRKGISVQDAVLYCTTFPCHICAKHIVASGIKRVVYLEPYPKSYAYDLHKDSIEIDNVHTATKVSFVPFIGVSPFRYRELFEKGKRKYSGGVAQKWHKGERRPMIEVYLPSYFKAETALVAELEEKLSSCSDKLDG